MYYSISNFLQLFLEGIWYAPHWTDTCGVETTKQQLESGAVGRWWKAPRWSSWLLDCRARSLGPQGGDTVFAWVNATYDQTVWVWVWNTSMLISVCHTFDFSVSKWNTLSIFAPHHTTSKSVLINLSHWRRFKLVNFTIRQCYLLWFKYVPRWVRRSGWSSSSRVDVGYAIFFCCFVVESCGKLQNQDHCTAG